MKRYVSIKNMQYSCKLCMYTTARLPDINRHKNSVKHKNNVEIFGEDIVDNIKDDTPVTCVALTNCNDNKLFLCDCGKAFSYKQGLYVHKTNTCKLTKEKKIQKENEKQQDNANLANVIIEMKSQMEALTNIIKTSHAVPNIMANDGNIIMTNSNNNNTHNNNILNHKQTYNVNVLTYVTDKFKNTEPLEELKTPDVHKFLEHGKIEGYSIEEAMIFYYKKKLFSQFIGEAIKTEYLKVNLEEQKFWASDVARLTFIVRRVLTKSKKKKENVWIKDPNGTSLMNLLIIPSLNEIRRVLSNYADECNEKMKHMDNYMMEKLGDNIFEANKIINDINLSEFRKPILRYIAPHFQLKLADNELLN